MCGEEHKDFSLIMGEGKSQSWVDYNTMNLSFYPFIAKCPVSSGESLATKRTKSTSPRVTMQLPSV